MRGVEIIQQLLIEPILYPHRSNSLTMSMRFDLSRGVEITPQLSIQTIIPQSLLHMQLLQEKYLPHEIVFQLIMVKSFEWAGGVDIVP